MYIMYRRISGEIRVPIVSRLVIMIYLLKSKVFLELIGLYILPNDELYIFTEGEKVLYLLYERSIEKKQYEIYCVL